MDCGVMAALWDSCAVMAYLCHSGGGYLGVLALSVIPVWNTVV